MCCKEATPEGAPLCHRSTNGVHSLDPRPFPARVWGPDYGVQAIWSVPMLFVLSGYSSIILLVLVGLLHVLTPLRETCRKTLCVTDLLTIRSLALCMLNMNRKQPVAHDILCTEGDRKTSWLLAQWQGSYSYTGSLLKEKRRDSVHATSSLPTEKRRHSVHATSSLLMEKRRHSVHATSSLLREERGQSVLVDSLLNDMK